MDILVLLLGEPQGIILGQLITASQYTIYLSLIAFLGGGLFGGLITFIRIIPNKPLNMTGYAYIWLFQALPLLMLLFLIGLGIPKLFEQHIDPWIAAALALVLFTSAYLSEVWRGAIIAIPRGQWEASMALNLSFYQTLRLVILPQAVKFSIAPTISFLIQIIKGTSLCYIIGFQDLMLIGKRWANSPVPGSEPFIIFPMMALFYFCLCYPLAIFAKRIEKKALIKG